MSFKLWRYGQDLNQKETSESERENWLDISMTEMVEIKWTKVFVRGGSDRQIGTFIKHIVYRSI